MNVDAILVIVGGAFFALVARQLGQSVADTLSHSAEAAVGYARWYRIIGIAMVLFGVLMLVT